MPTEYAPLYSRLAELAAAYVLPAAWSWLPVDVDCRQLVDDVGAWEQLSQQFPAEDLQNSGVASRANGQLVINPRLVGDESGFIVLRNAEGEPFDVVTGAGCLYGQIPALRMHLDRTTKQALSGVNRSFMYGTFSMLDTVLLRSLGVAVTPVARMETLDLPCLNRLLGLVGGTAEGDIPKAQVALPWDEPDDPVAGRTGRMQVRPAGFRLVLLAGSLAAGTADLPVSLPAVAGHLASAEEHLGFVWKGIKVWRPTPAERTNLRYRRQLRSAQAVRQFLSVDRAKHKLQAFGRSRPSSSSKSSLAETYFRLLEKQPPRLEASSGIMDPLSNGPASPNPYEAFVDRHFVQPFVDRALRDRDPEDQVLDLQMATLLRLYHRAVAVVYKIQGQMAQIHGAHATAILPPELFKQFTALSAQLLNGVRQRAAIHKDRWGGR